MVFLILFYLPISLIILKSIYQLIIDGSWDPARMQDLIPNNTINKFIQIPITSNLQDQVLFKPSFSRDFVFKSLWDYVRIILTFHHVFSKSVNSYYLLVWWILNSYIPIDALLWSKGFYLLSKCQCCYHIEDINHVFINGPIVVRT